MNLATFKVTQASCFFRSVPVLTHFLCRRAALLPVHLRHGQQRLGPVRPRQGRPLVRTGRLLGGDPQQAARHLPGRALLQAEAHCRWPRPPPALSPAQHVTMHTCLYCSLFDFVCVCAHPLQVMVDVEGKNEWKECIDIGGVRLPTGYFFGASAATGDLSGEFWVS